MRLASGALAAGVLAFWLAGPAGAQLRRPHGELFPPEDLGMLEGPDRDGWQRPDRIMDALGIADGSEVAEVGAGGGWFTIRLARRVGPNGRVFAEDIQRQMIESIARRIQREGLTNITTVLGTPDDPKLPVGRLDAVLFVDTFHEVEPRQSLLGHVRAALKPSGRLGIVDFKVDGAGPGPEREARVAPEVVIAEATAAGFRLLARDLSLPYHYLLVFAVRAA
jgi:predicted methyltransferase